MTLISQHASQIDTVRSNGPGFKLEDIERSPGGNVVSFRIVTTGSLEQHAERLRSIADKINNARHDAVRKAEGI